jgi:serine/threonine protein kinase
MTPQQDQSDLLRQQFPQIRSVILWKIGGFKAVYKADIDGRWEALKLVHLPPSGQDETGVAFRKEVLGRIRREIEALGKCVVPELVKLGTFSPTEYRLLEQDYVIYSEELLAGADLWDLIRSNPDIPTEAEMKQLFVCLLRAIRELWRHGYVHRDIKPNNVMKLSNPERPFVLLDLGIAYSIRETALTYNPTERLPPATFRYMAPEMAFPNFRKNLDYRSDLYSAALTVYEYGTKHHPLARDIDDSIQTITRALRIPARPVKEHRGDLSIEFCSVIDQLLKKKPALRPANLDSLIALMEGDS